MQDHCDHLTDRGVSIPRAMIALAVSAIFVTSVSQAGECLPECLTCPPQSTKIIVVHKRAPKEKWCKLPPPGVLFQTIPAVLLPQMGARVDPSELESAMVRCREDDLQEAVERALKKRDAETKKAPESETSREDKIKKLEDQLAKLSKSIEVLQTALGDLK